MFLERPVMTTIQTVTAADIKAEEIPEFGYRWVIMIVMSLALACVQFSVFISAGAVANLMGPDYGLTTVEFSMVSTMPYLIGFLCGIAAGAYADKRSIREVMIIGLVIALAGSVIRVFSVSFVMLLISSLLVGFALATLNSNSAKVFRIWFPKKGGGVAMGVYTTGASVGAAAALRVGVVCSVFQSFTIAAVLVAVSLVLWIVFAKTSEYEKTAHEPIVQYLGIVMKNRYVWLVSFFMFFLFGCAVAEQTFINSAFTELTGSANTASIIAMVNSICVAIGCIVMPLIVQYFKRIRPIMIIAAVLMCINMIAVLLTDYSWFTWFRMILQGVYMGILLPLGKMLPALIPGVKQEHLGAAGGVQSMFQNLGAWLIPAYIIAPIVSTVTGATNLSIYIGAGISVLLAGVCVLFIPETGTSIEAKVAREKATLQAQSAE